MNLTDRVNATTADLEKGYQAFESAIQDIRETQASLRRTIDARRLQERPGYPTFAQINGIIEAVRRFKAGEESSTHHGDAVGPEDEPYAVRYSPQLNLGWLHVAHGSPTAFGRSNYLWSFTDGEIEFLINYVEDQGVKVTDHWKSDGGVSMRFCSTEEWEKSERAAEKILQRELDERTRGILAEQNEEGLTSRELAKRPTVEDAHEATPLGHD